MKSCWNCVALLGAISAGSAGVAQAEIPVRAIYGGALYHDVTLADSKSGGAEQPPNIELEVQLESPRVFRYILDPSVYFVGSVNTRGDTSFGGFGLNWKFYFTKKWAFEPGIGYVVHDGALDFPFPRGDPRNTEFGENNILFGSRDLFRITTGVTRDFGPHWSGQLLYEHLSHGQIIGRGRNQGLDSIGLRLAYRFRDRQGRRIDAKES